MSHDPAHRGGIITGINVTPLVDVALVLLVILMVTATAIARQSIPLDLPQATTGEAVRSPLAISLDREGHLYLNGVSTTADALRQELRTRRAGSDDVRATLAADGGLEHRAVLRLVDMLRQEGITRFAIHVAPEDGAGSEVP